MKTNTFSFISGNDVNKPESISDIIKKQGKIVTVDGMIGQIRDLKQVAFVLTDLYRGTIQGVLEGETLEYLESIKRGDFIGMTGEVRLNEKTVNGVEIGVEDIKILGSGDTEGFQFHRKMKENLDVILDKRLISLRNIEQKSIFKLRDGILKAFREYLSNESFTEINTPKIVSTGAEGGADVFSLDYFGKKVFLAQSPQFYKQFMVPIFHRVFEVAPAFRAEKHGTSRHVNEYTSMDMEMGPINSYKEIMDVEVGLLRFIMNFLEENYSEELKILNVELPDLSNGIPEITFNDAKKLVSEEFNRPILDMYDMEPEEERLLSQIVKEKTGSEFVFITAFPIKKRPFYAMESTDNPGYTESFDLLFKGLEITTGGQRIDNYDMQVEKIIEKGLNPKDFKDFLKLHKAGTIPHGGIGIGSERLLQKLIGRDNIRETTLFPRDRKRLTP